METLLDRHLAALDTWLQARFMPSNAASRLRCYLAVVTLLDQLDPKEFNWEQVSVILQRPLPQFLFLFGEPPELNTEFTRIVSKYLIDRDRAGSFWLNSDNYADLATYILEILHDKSVYNPYILVRANTNA
jgi:hypothetical protein